MSDAPSAVRTLDAEQVTGAITFHGEGPIWDVARAVLHVVDLLAGDLVTLDPESGTVSRAHLGAVAACARPRVGGGFVVALERAFALVDPDGAVHRQPDVWADPGVRFNDGGCDPSGRFYCGTMAYDVAPGRGSLFRLDPDGTVSTVLEGLTISNGLGFAADGRSALYVDTPTGRVDRVEVDPVTGGFGARRAFVEIAPSLGYPDGIARDSEGGVWVALWGGGAVHRYDAAGRLDTVVRLPVTNVSCPALGGPDLRTLFVTTSRQDLPEGAEPQAGAVFAVRVDVSGDPVLPFAG